MMEERLQLGYNLIIGCDSKDDIYGGYMRKNKDGFTYYSLTGEEGTLIGNFPNVFTSLQEGLTLQAYHCTSGMTTVMLGKREEGHGEFECLDQTVLAYRHDLVSALMELDSVLENRHEKPIEYRKAYRLWDSDRYQFYTRQFMKENNLEE